MLGKRAESSRPDRIEAVLGKDTDIKGTLTAKGVIRLDGRFEGEVQVDGDILIGETAQLTANLRARNVTVAGLIRGNVDAEGRIELAATGKVIGDIKMTHLVVADGAVLQGTSHMRQAAQPTTGPGQTAAPVPIGSAGGNAPVGARAAESGGPGGGRGV